ncbi:MAG TPA: AAA family ATPase [Gaiellaceae bacterium]|nr:AAA family ATPase [Gaiellaceae bacterium]
MNEKQLSAQDFGPAFKAFLEQAASGVERQEAPFVETIRDHLGVDPRELEVVTQSLEPTERPNLQVALDAYLEPGGRSARIIGIVPPNGSGGVTITELISRRRGGFYGDSSIQIGPVEHVRIDLGEGTTLTCIHTALLLVESERGPVVVLIANGRLQGIVRERIEVQAMAPDREAAEAVLTDLRQEMRRRNVYRGRAISLEKTNYSGTKVNFHSIPTIERDQIILPEGVLERVESQAIVFSEQIERLRAAKRHLRRGLLLHGPPGTGKTMTAMYVAGRLPGRTVVLLTGSGLAMIEESVAFARMLEPSLVILEDVDLVAQERTRQLPGQNAVLFELLNQMDGITEDADVIFLLTTNRPDLLESALASRPGRIDQAVEIPLPDAACRRRLFDLYAEGLALDGELDRLVERTRGVSAAFIRELLRKAALLAVTESSNGFRVSDRHLDEALNDLVIEGGELTKVLLGGPPAPVA